MNNEEKNVMTVVTIARVVESTLWYCLPPRTGSFSFEERNARGRALKALTSEGSPFARNCDNNGDTGAKLKEEMQYFIEDCYGEEGRIVSVNLDNSIRVESSLINELYTNIVMLRGFLESFLHAAIDELRKRNTLEPDFEELVNTDIRYFHAFAGKIGTILLSDKFLELNKAAAAANTAYIKSHNGMNPKNDPNFNISDDPSFRMLENEFHQINVDLNAVLNSYGNNGQDDEFKFARESVYADCDIFTGKKQTTNVEAYFNVFHSYFDKILEATQSRLNNMFSAMGEKIKADNEANATSSPINARPVEMESPAQAAPAPEAESPKEGE